MKKLITFFAVALLLCVSVEAQALSGDDVPPSSSIHKADLHLTPIGGTTTGPSVVLDVMPVIPNPELQLVDTDGDGVPNVFDDDDDDDGILDGDDNCPLQWNPPVGPYDPLNPLVQADADGDGVGDLCDNCNYVANEDQIDTDHNGVGDACEDIPELGEPLADTDMDGVADGFDNCIEVPNHEQEDADGDGVGDACDVCLEDDDPAHQDLDDCAVADDGEGDGDEGDEGEAQGVEGVVTVPDTTLPDDIGGGADGQIAFQGGIGPGCAMAQSSPAFNALGVLLIGIGILQIFSRRRK